MIFYNIQHFGDGTWLPWLLRTLSGPDNQVLITYDGSAEAMAGIAADVTRDAPALKRLEVERSLPIRWCGPSQAQMQIEALRRALKRDGWEFFGDGNESPGRVAKVDGCLGTRSALIAFARIP